MEAGEGGSSWADVGLALVAFAREDPVVFCGVLAFVSVIIYILMPRARQLYAGRLRDRLEQEVRHRVQGPGRDDRREKDDA